MKASPICPVAIPEDIAEIIKDYCPISQCENIEDQDPDNESRIYKYVGFINQDALEEIIPRRYCQQYYLQSIVSLYEKADENIAILWFDNILIVMVSTDEEQHEGEMNMYSDVALLLTQVGNDRLTCRLFKKVKGKEDD